MPSRAPDVAHHRALLRYAVHVGLFAATCVTTYLAGGAAFAATLMTILVCHEAGHYVVARRYGIDASLPYFIPLPPPIGLGTLGAVIRMDEPIRDRNQLIDVGAAGPLAGLAVAIPLLSWGLSLSPVKPAVGEGVIEGNSVLYAGLKLALKGQWLPGGGLDVQLHPMAFAAWVGLLITMINLIPVGQLDGGHIACAYLGDHHERSSRWVHRALLGVGAAVVAVLTGEALAAGARATAALAYGAAAGAPWLVWSLMLLGMRAMSGGVYHPPVGAVPLTAGRRWLVLFMGVVFLLIVTPVPLRPTLTP